MIATTDLLLADPSDGAPHDPQSPGESPGGGGGEAMDGGTCESCMATKPNSAFTTVLNAPPNGPIICDACLDTLPMDLLLATRRLNELSTLPATEPALLCPLCETNEHRATQCPAVAAEKARQARTEAAGRGIARQMRHDRARFLRCVARVGPSDRTAMAGALAFYLSAQTRLFTSAPISAERILAFWAHENAVLAF